MPKMLLSSAEPSQDNLTTLGGGGDNTVARFGGHVLTSKKQWASISFAQWGGSPKLISSETSRHQWSAIIGRAIIAIELDWSSLRSTEAHNRFDRPKREVEGP